ncbi:hypothetical protein BGZ58_007828 [Dissophora ornata]|nr:hypothetical protein BGZ58_007828 [Dissophora ornata]
MLKYVKDGALDLLALTLPSSLLESIRQVSEDDFLSPQVSNRQPLPRARRQNTSSLSSRAVARNHRNHRHSRRLPSDAVLPQCGSEVQSRSQHHVFLDPSKPTIQLPYEILALIFQCLPASDLFSVLAVSRLWRQIAFLETKQIDISECFPMDCLGLDDEVYSDFDFVYNLFSLFPLISSLVIKDRFMRDRDLRVVTAGILAGKMAFTAATGPAIGSEIHRKAQAAIAERRQQTGGQQSGNSRNHVSGAAGESPSTTKPPIAKLMRGTIKEDLREFSRSVGTYVLIPQTRNTLRKKILERLEHNLEQKEIQEYCWMLENGIDPDTFYSFTAASLSSSLGVPPSTTSVLPLDAKRYPLVPMTHYRFQDCCFANDWGAAMDVNKLPMIGLAAAISGQGLVVDLEGSYGAPSKSIKTMLGFCFGAHCVISLDLNFRHTHMELEHVAGMLSENPILYKIDIVDSPAYHELIRLPALRGLGGLIERMQEACVILDEGGLEVSLQEARLVLSDLERSAEQEVSDRKESRTRKNAAQESSIDEAEEMASMTLPEYITPSRPLDDPKKPIESLSQQLVFPEGTSLADKLRTAKVLLKGVIYHGIVGLINTRDKSSGQSLLHTLAWRRSLSLPATLWIPEDSEDIGVGGGSLPTPDVDDNCPLESPTDSTGRESPGFEAMPDELQLQLQEQQRQQTSAVAMTIPEQHPVAIALQMAKALLRMKANPNVYNKGGRSAVVCASFMGFQPMEVLLIEQGGYSKELIRIRETM